MHHITLICLILLAFIYEQSIALPNGAPESVCHSLLPFHGGGIPPATSRPPFRLDPFNIAVNQGQVLRIEIRSQVPELSFGGFMIQARSTNPPYQVVGRFAPSADRLVKLINCGGFENTATHTSPSPKSSISLQWQAPADFIGDVIFKYANDF